MIGTDCSDCGPRGIPQGSAGSGGIFGGGTFGDGSSITTSSVCEETCNYSADGDCDDGGAGAEYTACTLGTDCLDCGSRVALDYPPPSPTLPPPWYFDAYIGGPSHPPSPPIPVVEGCYAWCEGHAMDLPYLATHVAAASMYGTHALDFAWHLGAVASSIGVNVNTLTNPAPPAPPPPPAADVFRMCFDAGFTYLPGCTCHESCLTCGFGPSPTTDSDCITCLSGAAPTIVNGAGALAALDGSVATGFCGPPVSAADMGLVALCYGTCDVVASGVPSPPPASTTSLGGGTCSNECVLPYDGECDDGGPGSEWSICTAGSDCADCGPRGAPPSPPKDVPQAPPPPPIPPHTPPLSPPSVSAEIASGTPCSSSFLGDAAVELCENWCHVSDCGRCSCAACGACAPYPPPPGMPPLPPGLTTVVYQAFEIDMTVAGVVDLYASNTGLLANQSAAIASSVGVNPANVTIAVLAASTRLHVSIRSNLPVDSPDAVAQRSAVDNVFSNPAAASQVLQAPVISTPQVMQTPIAVAVPVGDSVEEGLSTTVLIVIIAGAILAIVVLAIVAKIFCCKRGVKTVPATSADAACDVDELRAP